MKSLSGVNRLSKERCECNNCDRELSVDEVKHTWKCPSCGEHLHIYAEDDETGTKIVLIRKAAREIEKGDLVHLPGGLTKESYMVLGVSEIGQQLGIGLKGYGQLKVLPSEPINCRVGAW